jgi:sugar phosphate isomerase/epimerase
MKMRFCGHTMGTPNYNALESTRLFKDIGCDGIEFRCAKDGHINTETIPPGQIKDLAAAARDIGIEIACLTPYYQDYVRPEARVKSLDGMKRAVEVAAALGCRRVRAYGGILPPPGFTQEAAWERAVSGIRETGTFAAQHDVSLCVENHIGTLTMSAADTVRFVRDVGLANVGILFDYAWVVVAGQESAPQAVALMRPYLLHAHVRTGGSPARRRTSARPASSAKGTLTGARRSCRFGTPGTTDISASSTRNTGSLRSRTPPSGCSSTSKR